MTISQPPAPNGNLEADGAGESAQPDAPIRQSEASDALLGFVNVTGVLTQRQEADEKRLTLAKAEEAIKLRDEFLSLASHELNTPLTALLFQLQGLADLVPSADKRFATRLDRARRLAERLSQLIDAILDVSHIVSGELKLNLETFDLVDAVKESAERLRATATRAGCSLSMHVRGPIEGRWDRLRIEQILTNLISNSIKYAAGGPIQVSAAQENEAAVLQVRDRGAGIPEAQLSRIFERFERAASARNHGGMGLGLYVARQIAEAHGGSIEAANLPGRGACFTVRLPLDFRQPAPA